MNPTRVCRLAALALSLLAVGAAWPQAAPPSRPSCAAAEHRQFDFWLGRWEVVDTAGRVVGTNHIESVLGGCVVRETWTGAAGTEGRSYNLFDRATQQWHQTWVDDAGTLLRLSGGLENGAMVMSGHVLSAQGGRVLHRIVWTPLEDGRVRQHWQASQDEGGTWGTVFDGLYRKRPGAQERAHRDAAPPGRAAADREGSGARASVVRCGPPHRLRPEHPAEEGDLVGVGVHRARLVLPVRVSRAPGDAQEHG
jgi:hypothetical protein